MSRFAPVTPSTAELKELYFLDELQTFQRDEQRDRVNEIFRGNQPGIVGIIGSCAMNEQGHVIRQQGQRLKEVNDAEPGLVLLDRECPWKPRSNPDSWHGLETTDPRAAFTTLYIEAALGSGMAIEVNWQDEQETATHLDRYGDFLVAAWLGSRAVGDSKLVERLAVDGYDIALPVKNGLDGNLNEALEVVERVNQIRGVEGAPSILIYRGGENATNPDDWEREYRRAYDMTDGKMIVDLAHMTEMAHDPEGGFQKSVAGQEAAKDHVTRLAEEDNIIPAGVMAEASNVNRTVDPHMAHETAIGGLINLNELRRIRTGEIVAAGSRD